MEEALVVPWCFPHGPGVGARNIQDSFSIASPAHSTTPGDAIARLPAASSTPISTSCWYCPRAARSSIGPRRVGKAATVFPGLWTESAVPAAGLLRHSDCLHSERWRAAFRGVLPYRHLLRTKWIVLPGSCPEDADWGVHDLYPASPQARARERSWKQHERGLLYRHFRPITTGWKSRRRGRCYSPFIYGYDRDFVRAFALAFPDRPLSAPKSPLIGNLARLFGRRAK